MSAPPYIHHHERQTAAKELYGHKWSQTCQQCAADQQHPQEVCTAPSEGTCCARQVSTTTADQCSRHDEQPTAAVQGGRAWHLATEQQGGSLLSVLVAASTCMHQISMHIACYCKREFACCFAVTKCFLRLHSHISDLVIQPTMQQQGLSPSKQVPPAHLHSPSSSDLQYFTRKNM